MPFSQADAYGIPLENKLDDIFNKKTNGFFIELGANDGVFQSNTLFFEKTRGWKGILIEPSVSGYESCKKARPNSISLNYACVSNTYTDEYVLGDFQSCHPMASINGERLNSNNLTLVKATTLEKILDIHACNEKIDFLSLDTEGYELNILQGLNLNKYRPKHMLIEIYTKDYDNILKFLSKNNYKLHSNFTNYSLSTNPAWDGTHNDYLFIDNT